MMETIAKTFEILLVEDSPDDIRLTNEALKEIGINHHLRVLIDGEEAIEYLSKMRANSGKELPDLILLDLNMPKKNGHEVLAFMKQYPEFNDIPIIVLTVCQAEQDITRALNLRMNYYLNKPVNPEKLEILLSVIGELWSDK